MKIIILGAGQVGGTLAENLVGEQNDITVVDTNIEKLRALQDRYDLQVVHGHSAHPDILKRAGAEDADMIIAVTSSDEVKEQEGKMIGVANESHCGWMVSLKKDNQLTNERGLD